MNNNNSFKRRLFLFFLFFFFVFSAFSNDPLEIKIAVIGPGDELYFWWGHIGLIIENHETGDSRFYDWGVFSFDNENFFLNFAFGRLLYTCAVTRPEFSFYNYVNTNRDITLYTLNLTPEKKQEIQQYAIWSMLPENRDYLYHHFQDNCATRIRDIIDIATDGLFGEKYKNTPGRFTLREHVRRHTWFNPFFDWILNFWMGQVIDTPITVWDEMFLPSEIALRIEEFAFFDSGSEQRLLSNKEIVFSSSGRPQVLDAPIRLWPRLLALSLFIALAFILLFVFRQRGSAKAHYIWAIGQGVMGLFFGGCGLILFFMNFFTLHDYTYRNINLLYINPLLLAAIPIAILCCIRYSKSTHINPEKISKTLWSLVFDLCILSIIINKLFLGQQNLSDIIFFLPIAASLSWLPDLAVLIKRR